MQLSDIISYLGNKKFFEHRKPTTFAEQSLQFQKKITVEVKILESTTFLG